MNLSDFLKLWRVEKSSTQLAQMPPDLYSEARALIQSGDAYESKKAATIYNDLIHMRQHKMLMGCLRELRGGNRPKNLLATEKAVYKRIFEELASMRSGDIQYVDETVIKEKKDNGQEQLTKLQEDVSGDDIGVPKLGDSSDEKPSGEGKESAKASGRAQAESEEKEESVEAVSAEEPSGEQVPRKPEQEDVGQGAEEPLAEKPGGGRPAQSEPGRAEQTGQEALEKKQGEQGEETDTKIPAGSNKAEAIATADANSPVFKGETENKDRMRVRFVKSMPAFVGPDLETLGPFEEDQIVELDAKIAEILLNNDAVELA